MEIIEVKSNPDYEIARGLFLEYAREIEIDLSFQDFDVEIGQLSEQYGCPDGVILLIEYEGGIAGCIGLRKFRNGEGEIKRLFIRERFRGMGLGKILVSEILNKARRLNYRCLKLDTLPNMIPAIELYKSFGFVETKPYRYNPIEGAVFMELKL